MSFSTFNKDIIEIFENIRIDEPNNYFRVETNEDLKYILKKIKQKNHLSVFKETIKVRKANKKDIVN